MSRIIEANEASRATVEQLPADKARQALLAIHDVLWPRKDPANVIWTERTAETIANIVRNAVYDVD
jgi:hypothetical protein